MVPVPGFDPEVRERLGYFQLEFGNTMVIDVIDSFITDTDHRLSGLRQLIENSDFKNLVREAHALRGSYGNMGAIKMSNLCLSLEDHGRAGSYEVAGIVEELKQTFLQLRPALELHKLSLIESEISSSQVEES